MMKRFSFLTYVLVVFVVQMTKGRQGKLYENHGQVAGNATGDLLGTVYRRQAECVGACVRQNCGGFSFSGDTCVLETFDENLPRNSDWTVYRPGVTFLLRRDASVNFTRPWADYKAGFGSMQTNYWMGLEQMHQLTSGGGYGLRVDMEAWDGGKLWTVYSSVTIGPESDGYRLGISGYNDNSTAGDTLMFHSSSNLDGMKFTALDRDNDMNGNGNCAVGCYGAWWYNNCHKGKGTGLYMPANTESVAGNFWASAPDYPNQYNFKFMVFSFIRC